MLTEDDLQTPAPPGQPYSTRITDHSVVLSWPVSPSADVTHYVIEYRNVEYGPDAWKLALDKVETTSCTVDELTNEDEYVFRVFAYNDTLGSEPSQPSEKILIEGKSFLRDK